MCVINPEAKLITNVAANLHIDNSHPIVPVLKKNISGSIEGDAIQKDITGAKGTPPSNKEAIIGITPQEQNGLIAPTIVAKRIETTGFLLITLLIIFDEVFHLFYFQTM